jgi:hypothetical protein
MDTCTDVTFTAIHIRKRNKRSGVPSLAEVAAIALKHPARTFVRKQFQPLAPCNALVCSLTLLKENANDRTGREVATH